MKHLRPPVDVDPELRRCLTLMKVAPTFILHVNPSDLCISLEWPRDLETLHRGGESCWMYFWELSAESSVDPLNRVAEGRLINLRSTVDELHNRILLDLDD